VAAAKGLGGNLIARRVRRLFDQRCEARDTADGVTAELDWRGKTVALRLDNLSSSGAMVIWDEMPHIGERVAFRLPDGRAAPGDICWVRDGRVGLNFAAPLVVAPQWR